MNRLLINRSVYNVLDYLGDIGGLFGTFTGLATTFTLILNFNGIYHKLTSLLFRAQTLSLMASQKSSQKKSAENNGGGKLQSLFVNRLAGQLDSQFNKTTNIQEFQTVNQNFFTTLILNFKQLLPQSCRCLCCKERTRDRIFS